MSQAVDDVIAKVRETETVLDSALAYIQAVPGLIRDAVTAAVANGATAEELAPLTTLSSELQAKATAVKDALVANTPQAA